MKKINIGIIAHVDAGKTTLTENILYLTGVISKKGRVDYGDTQTDSLEVERRRGISVKAAATSFYRRDVKCNLIDTPGHVDFIAEVERALHVLDGVVLLISAKEGIQSQTRILMDTVKSLKIPAVFFINKTDRIGADPDKVFSQANVIMDGRLFATGLTEKHDDGEIQIREMTPDELLLNNIGIVCDLNDDLMERYVSGSQILFDDFWQCLTHLTNHGELYPVFFGSALFGTGVEALLDNMLKYLPYASDDTQKPLCGVVFKIVADAREKQAYIRIYQGMLRIRSIIEYNGKQEKITRLTQLVDGKLTERQIIEAGDIGVIYCKDLRIGDIITEQGFDYTQDAAILRKLSDIKLARPTISVEIKADREQQKRQLYEALTRLADEDPLLSLSNGKEPVIKLFGEVQMEIIKELLFERYGIPISFANSMTIFMETVSTKASAKNQIYKSNTPYAAGVGFTVEPLPRGSGIEYVSEVWLGNLEKTFQNAVKEAVFETCERGLYGWEITDAKIIFDFSEYNSVESTPSDYRNLTPLVLMEAFVNAGMELLEPMLEFELRAPDTCAGKLLFDCERMRAVIDSTTTDNGEIYISGLIPADTCKGYGTKVASYSEGLGVFVTKFHSYKTTEYHLSKVNEPLINLAVNKTKYLLHKSNAI